MVFMTGKRFPRSAVLGEEFQLASADASSLSQTAGSAHPRDLALVSSSMTSSFIWTLCPGICCFVFTILEMFCSLFLFSPADIIGGETIENDCDELSDNLTSSQDSSTSEKSLPTTGSMQRWFPYDDCFKLDDERTLTSSDVISMLSPFLGDERKQRIEEVVANRTYSVCIAVEGLLDLGNISAVCRSADALGFQSVHVVSNGTKKK